jgi:hypothetical protein
MVAAAVAFAHAVGGCSGGQVGPNVADGGAQDAMGGTGSSGGGGSGGSSGSSSGGSSGGSAGSSSGGSGGSSGSSSGGDSGVASDAGMVPSPDGFGASRAACIAKINALRATSKALALQPYTLQNTDPTNTCVDTQATNDQSHDSPHESFINDSPSCTWGSPAGTVQDECQSGYGTTPAGIEACIQDMWDQSLQPNCLGCVGCTAPGGACANCDYYGTKGYFCGDYVDLSAPYFTTVACGFAGASPSTTTGWSVMNLE